MSVRIDLVSDIICPWCYIGLRRLEAAQDLLGPDFDCTLVWHPYQLDPTLPPEGKDRRAYLEAKFGGPEGARAVYARVEEAGALSGIAFAFDRITLTPNTLPGHILLEWAAGFGPQVQTRLARSFFAAYFENGINLAQQETLLDLAAASGLPRDDAAAALASKDLRLAVGQQLRLAARAGISGVPFFIVNNTYGISGAQPPEVLADALRQIAAKDGGSADQPAA